MLGPLPSLTEEDSRVRRKREQTRELAKEKRDKLFGITEEKKGDTVAVSAARPLRADSRLLSPPRLLLAARCRSLSRWCPL